MLGRQSLAAGQPARLLSVTDWRLARSLTQQHTVSGHAQRSAVAQGSGVAGIFRDLIKLPCVLLKQFLRSSASHALANPAADWTQMQQRPPAGHSGRSPSSAILAGLLATCGAQRAREGMSRTCRSRRAAWLASSGGCRPS